MTQAIKKVFLILFCMGLFNPAFADTKLQIVTSFSILADMAKNIAGDKATVDTIVGPNSDAHAFEPTPRNVRQLAKADLLIINGLNFEPWISRLKQAAGFDSNEIVATNNINALHINGDHHDEHDHHDDHDAHEHSHGDIDPHAWQSLPNAKIYVNNIKNALINLDPENRSYYEDNTNKYIEQINELDKQLKANISTIPRQIRTVLTSHDSFGYFAQEYDIDFIAISGLSSTAEPSAKRISEIIDTIKNQHISSIHMESMVNNSILEQIASSTKSTIGGTLYSDALADDKLPASTYIGMMRWNADQIIDALKMYQKRNFL